MRPLIRKILFFITEVKKANSPTHIVVYFGTVQNYQGKINGLVTATSKSTCSKNAIFDSDKEGISGPHTICEISNEVFISPQ